MSNDTALPSYVDRVREDTQNYIRRLLAENEQLRVAGAQLGSELSRLRQELASTREELSHRANVERELAETMARIREEGQRYLAQYAEVEMHNANLANLYVASHQLHGTLERGAILEALQEIVVNLIGSEEFAICEISGGELTVAASVGVEAGSITWDTPHVREAAETRALFVAPPKRAPHEPLVCLPLQVDGHLVGIVVILGLLAHKAQLEPLDHELFDLIATHASTALYCCGLQTMQKAVRAS
jgi:nitrate/nitrite-specific signal transduction histidine kinase